MCGRRTEGWGGLLPSAMTAMIAPNVVDAPVELPSEHDRTRPVVPSASLLQKASHVIDEESLRPTREMPSIGHELRAMAPDHRVHTSPTGNVLPEEVKSVLLKSAQSISASIAARAMAPTTLLSAMPNPDDSDDPLDGDDDAPDGPLPEDNTDQIRVRRRGAAADFLRMALLAVCCAGIAVGVGLLAYRIMLPAQRVVPADGAQRSGAPAPAPAPANEQANSPGAGTSYTPLFPGVHRTRDLIVNVLPLRKRIPERHGRTQGKAYPLPPAVPPSATSSTPLSTPTAPAEIGQGDASFSPATSLTPVTPMTPMTEEEQRHEAEAQLAAADIEFVASNNHVQVRTCHERAFKDATGSPGGRVELSFTLREDGRASGVTTLSNTTGSLLLSRCLEQRVAEWRFPRPVGGAKTYQFPFVFMAAPSSSSAGGP